MVAATRSSIDRLEAIKIADRLLSLWFGYNNQINFERLVPSPTRSEDGSSTYHEETPYLDQDDPIVIVGMGDSQAPLMIFR